MSALKKLAQQTALYGLSSMLGRIVNFLLVPFYTSVSVLDRTEFGIMTDLYAYIAFFNVIYLHGMETAYFRYANKTSEDGLLVYRHAQTQVTSLSLILSLLIILLSYPLASLLQYPQHYELVIYTAFILFLDGISAVPFAKMRQENKALKFAVLKLLGIFVNVGFNLFFLWLCPKILEGKLFPEMASWVSTIYDPSNKLLYIFLSNLAASAITLLFLLPYFKFKPVFSKALFKPMSIYAYPIMFMGLAGMVDEMMGRMLLKYFLPENFYPGLTSLQALGVYGACYKLSMFMSLAVQSFRYAGEPFFFSRAEDKNAPELFAKVMKWFIISCAFILVVVGSNLDLFGLLLRNPQFREGIMVVPVLLLANLFLGIYYSLSPWYKLTDRTYFGTWMSIGGACITIIANIALIPVLGYMGSAISTLICYFSMATYSYVIGQKYFPIPYRTGNAVFYILTAVILVTISILIPYYTELTGFWYKTALGAGLSMVYLIMVFICEKREIRFKA